MTKDRVNKYCEAEFENIDATLAELALIYKTNKNDYSTGELAAMAKYLSFRHFFIHGYGFTLKWEALQPLVVNINKTLQDFKTTINKHLS